MNNKTTTLLTLLILFYLLPVHGQITDEYVVKDLSVGSDGLIRTIRDGTVDLEIRISDNHQASTSGFFIPCLGSMGSQYGSLRLEPEGYIDVLNNGSSSIYSVEYVGCSTSQADASNCLSGVSTGEDTYPAYYKEKNKPATNITAGINLSGDTEDACRGYRILIPDTVYTGLGGASQEHINFRSQVHTIRLMWTGGVFAGKSNSSMGEVPEIYGLKITTISDSSVGIVSPSPTDSAPSITLYRTGKDTYRIDRLCDVSIYDLEGRIIYNKRQGEEFSLPAGEGGLYIVKLTDNISGISQVRKLTR